MKILLVNPPRSPENGILEYAPPEAERFIHKKLIGPPLGLMTIAAAVRDRAEVRFLEMKGEYDLHPDAPDLVTMVREECDKFRPDMVGSTFIASEFDFGLDIFRTAKKWNPEVLTVAGGVHATIRTEDFEDPCVDIVCPGHSAHIFRDLVDALARGQRPESVQGLHARAGGTGPLTFTGGRLDSWEPAGRDFIIPDRSLLNRWLGTYVAGPDKHINTYVFTSLGCPYSCTFCSIWPQMGGRYLTRNVESVIAELLTLEDYPAVRFADANTVVGTEFMSTLFDRILEEGIRKTFIMDIRADTAVRHPELIEKMARGGLKVVICGFESFREEELKKYRKGSSAAIISRAIDIFHDNDIWLRGNYVIPCDYGADDFKAMTDYASGHKVVYAGYTILTPIPGTALYEEKKNEIIDFDLKKYNFFNAVLPTRFPKEEFYHRVGSLWLIKEGTEII